MLDNETKRRIDTARDILVGRVPDPKSQVEQITIALIYKFMDDMDKESIGFGGEATFFSGEFEKYSWTKIFDTKVGGYELMNLYGEAIVRLNQNPNMPQFFRDIFKNANLPFREPETLKMFLKVINEFTYDHSEKLGDAFEYLLSILGSQGDAGQFRTPRHIIDFIVAVLQPNKNETILDPACGTAGFLISSYKYIIEENTRKTRGDMMTPDEKKKLIQNFVGYDISPDMVRLSLVNMYLHNFIAPHIYEYDTLTSEERWGDHFDVVMANPPFMSPKGGIRPHKKFTMQANRSEVLFVDYIAEHIHPSTGRAGVIVPEGIIFQSANAYKGLRKLLVEKNFLYAVVSLPAGIFQPYSGVKTSILFMDKTLAKKTNNILFAKIENDGFDLGAQRRAIDKNDLTAALEILNEYKNLCLNPDSYDFPDFLDSLNHTNPLIKKIIVQTVAKEKIAATADYNLSIDRYRVNENVQQSNFEMVRLGDVCEIKTGKKDVNYATEDGQYPFFTCAAGQFKSPDYSFDDEAILLPGNGANVGMVFYFKGKFEAYQRTYVLSKFKEGIIPKYVFSVLQAKWQIYIMDKQFGSATNYIVLGALSEFTFPLSPLSIQQQIVSKIESFQKIIDGAKQIVENYKPQIDIDEGWEMVKLGEVCEVNPETILPTEVQLNGEFIYVDITSVENGTGFYSLENIIKVSEAPSRARRKIKDNDVLLSTVRPNLKAFALIKSIPKNAIASTGFAVLRCNEKLHPKFIYELLFTDILQEQMISQMGKGSYPSINQTNVINLQIPLPPLSIQQSIVSSIEQEQQLVNGNKELIKIFEGKIKEEIGKLWKRDQTIKN